jgi:hypothetical protein
VWVIINVLLSLTLIDFSSQILHNRACLVVWSNWYNWPEFTTLNTLSWQRWSYSNDNFKIVIWLIPLNLLRVWGLLRNRWNASEVLLLLHWRSHWWYLLLLGWSVGLWYNLLSKTIGNLLLLLLLKRQIKRLLLLHSCLEHLLYVVLLLLLEVLALVNRSLCLLLKCCKLLLILWIGCLRIWLLWWSLLRGECLSKEAIVRHGLHHLLLLWSNTLIELLLLGRIKVRRLITTSYWSILRSSHWLSWLTH